MPSPSYLCDGILLSRGYQPLAHEFNTYFLGEMKRFQLSFPDLVR